MLKNNIRTLYDRLAAEAPAILADVKAACLFHIGDKSSLIRATVGLIITMIVLTLEIK